MGADGKGYTVLVVDDEELLRELIVQILDLEGHRCLVAANGRAALDLMDDHPFDAVITDICMPELDGIALTREVLCRYGDLPIMVITGYPDRYSAASAIQAGAREFIVKPFSSTELMVSFHKMMADFAQVAEIRVKNGALAQQSQFLDEVASEAGAGMQTVARGDQDP